MCARTINIDDIVHRCRDIHLDCQYLIGGRDNLECLMLVLLFNNINTAVMKLLIA